MSCRVSNKTAYPKDEPKGARKVKFHVDVDHGKMTLGAINAWSSLLNIKYGLD
jgi:hypothetical protein